MPTEHIRTTVGFAEPVTRVAATPQFTPYSEPNVIFGVAYVGDQTLAVPGAGPRVFGVSANLPPGAYAVGPFVNQGTYISAEVTPVAETVPPS